MAKLTLEEVKEIYKSKGLDILDNVYKNTKTKINCVDSEGYKYALTVDSVKDERTQSFSRFDAFNPHTVENIKHYISINNINVKLVSSEYKSMNKDKLIFECECGEHYNVILNHFLTNEMYKCKKCSMSQEGKNKLTLKQVKERVIKQGFIPLFETYIDRKTTLDIQDKNGYKGSCTLSNLNITNSVSAFDYRNPYIFYNIQKYIQINNIKCKVIETDYKGRDSKLTFTCAECGKKFKTTWTQFSLYDKYRCDVCTKAQSNISLKTEVWLIEHGFEYEKEASFEGCVYKRKLRFDYKVYTNNGFVLIEVDGSYHYTNPHSEDLLIKQKLKDEIKNKYCNENNIELIRLPWWWFRESELYKKELSNKLLG